MVIIRRLFCGADAPEYRDVAGEVGKGVEAIGDYRAGVTYNTGEKFTGDQDDINHHPDNSYPALGFLLSNKNGISHCVL